MDLGEKLKEVDKRVGPLTIVLDGKIVFNRIAFKQSDFERKLLQL